MPHLGQRTCFVRSKKETQCNLKDIISVVKVTNPIKNDIVTNILIVKLMEPFLMSSEFG